MTAPTRRTLLAGAAALAAGKPADAGQDDAELIAMCRQSFEFEERWLALLARVNPDGPGDGAKLAQEHADEFLDGAESQKRDLLLLLIARTPARTLEGVRAKMRLVSQWHQDRFMQGIMDPVLWSAIDDLTPRPPGVTVHPFN